MAIYHVPRLRANSKPRTAVWWYNDGIPDNVWMRCPIGHIGSLNDHNIQPDGLVSPSVRCPEHGCGFHEVVKLDNFEPPNVSDPIIVRT